MRGRADKPKRAVGRGRTVEPLSRRAFLSSVAATGAVVIWPTTVMNAEASLHEDSMPPAPPALPPPAGQEASYEWYLGQYTDPTMFTPIGLPADPAETAVSPNGELLYANDLVIQCSEYKRPPHPRNAAMRETRWHLRSLRRARLCPSAQGSPRGSPWKTVATLLSSPAGNTATWKSAKRRSLSP